MNNYKKKIEVLKSFVDKKNKFRPIINNIMKNNVYLVATDLYNSISIPDPTGIENGIYMPENLKNGIYIKENYDIEDYPNINFDISDDYASCIVRGGELQQAIEKTIFAVATTTDNIAIRCVRISVQNNIMSLYTTDCYQLAKTQINCISSQNFEYSLDVKCAKALQKDLKNFRLEDVEFFFKKGEKNLHIQYADRRIITSSRMLHFPDAESILENVPENYITINRKKLLEVVKKHNIISKKFKSYQKNISNYDFCRDGIRIQSGTLVSDLKCIESNNIDIRVGLNDNFLVNFLKTSKNDVVKIYVSENKVLMEDNERLYICMAARI